jgi:hypothetical protein
MQNPGSDAGVFDRKRHGFDWRFDVLAIWNDVYP